MGLIVELTGRVGERQSSFKKILSAVAKIDMHMSRRRKLGRGGYLSEAVRGGSGDAKVQPERGCATKRVSCQPHRLVIIANQAAEYVLVTDRRPQ